MTKSLVLINFEYSNVGHIKCYPKQFVLKLKRFAITFVLQYEYICYEHLNYKIKSMKGWLKPMALPENSWV